MASLEEILAYKAAERAQEGDVAKNAGTVLGATGGSLLGMMAGIPIHKVSQALGEIQGAGATRQSLKALKPGARMAGGLVGMIVGGGLGNAIAAQAVKENPGAELLAKLQVQGSLNPSEEMALQELVGSYYKGA